ncbi:MAG: hypothetical protein K5888_04800 [Lachnospiraceae bacterium]|nr:hypothetical protein [Lachnospiraceae bacterium]
MKNKKLFLVPAALLFLVAVICLVLAVRSYKLANKPYLKCNDHILTKTEYEYYYNSYKQFYTGSFSQFFSYMGVDETKELEDQEYENGKTFGQMFAEETCEQIKETYALYDDGIKNGFEFDAGSSFEEYYKTVDESCRASGSTSEKYFKQFYGEGITVKLIREYMTRGFYSAAYYDHLAENSSDEEAYRYVNDLKAGYKTEFIDDKE